MRRPFAFSDFQKGIPQSYLIIIVGGLVPFYTLVTAMVRESSLKTAKRNQISMCIKVSQQLESFMAEACNVGFQVIMNSRLIQDFGTSSGDKVSDNYHGDHIVDHINAVSALADISGTQKIVTRISVFNKYGDCVSSGVTPQSRIYADDILHNRMDINGIVSKLVPNDEHIYVEGPHPDYWNNKAGYEVVSLYRPLGNKIQDDMYGIIEIQQDFQKLVQTLLPGLGQDMAVFPSDSGGRHASSSMESIYPPEYYDFHYSQAPGNQGNRYGFGRVKVGGKAQEQYLSVGISEVSGWMAAMVRNKSSIVNVIQDIQKIITMAILVFMVLSAYTAYRILLKMTKPINDMIISAQSISWSNLDMEALEDNAENEIMALDNTFKETLRQLSESMRLELGARLNALQNRMDPHFLCNTLPVIGTSVDQQEGVERMYSRLSGMLRHSTVYEEESNSTLEDGVRHMKNYPESMKNQHEENLIYDTEEAGNLDRVKVPRVVLQPTVENYFKHGFGENRFPWMVHVVIIASDGCWKIHIGNNGWPLQERGLRELNEKAEGLPKGEQKKISGIGLTNIIIRLRFLYEGRAEYEMYTGSDGYTCVVLKGNYK